MDAYADPTDPESFSPINLTAPALDGSDEPDPSASLRLSDGTRPQSSRDAQRLPPPREVSMLSATWNSQVRDTHLWRYCGQHGCEGGHPYSDEHREIYWCDKLRLTRKQRRELS